MKNLILFLCISTILSATGYAGEDQKINGNDNIYTLIGGESAYPIYESELKDFNIAVSCKNMMRTAASMQCQDLGMVLDKAEYRGELYDSIITRQPWYGGGRYLKCYGIVAFKCSTPEEIAKELLK